MENYIIEENSLKILSDCTLDISKISPDNKQDGKIFIGWCDAAGNAVVKDSFSEGEILSACFCDYDKYDKYNMTDKQKNDGDFRVCGVQIKFSGKEKFGLRFITKIKGSLLCGLPEVLEYGTAVMPSDIVLGRDMQLSENIIECDDGEEHQTRYLYTKDAIPTLVPATKRIEDLPDGGVRYSLYITDIAPENYKRFYTVKGYIKWRDLQGAERVLLTEYAAGSLYSVVRSVKSNQYRFYADFAEKKMQEILDKVEKEEKLAYFKENYDSGTYLDAYGKPVLVNADKADKVTLVSGYDGVEWSFHGGVEDIAAKKADTSGKKDARYNLYRLKNGLKVREVIIDSGKHDESDDSISIVQFADTHFNYLNNRDFEEKNPALMSTAIYRMWNASLKGSESTGQGLRAVEYANMFDKAIVTGDMIDFLSWGSADMTKAILFDRLYNGTFVLGNHEPTRRMQGKEKDPFEDDAYNVLAHIWQTDIYYHSEILYDKNGVEKVMCVCMQNSDYHYYDVQPDKLKADILLCREKKIPMLIFEHVPIGTNGNTDEDTSTKLLCIAERGDSNTLPKNIGSADYRISVTGGTPATASVMKLITENADVIRGVFCGDSHNWFYSEIFASYKDENGNTVEYDENGNHIFIPQYTVTANAYASGNVTKITVR